MPRQLSPNSVLQTLEKISSSRTFRFAARQRSFLRYIVRKTLEGRADQLKEYSIGLAVFQKSETFDPRLDSIVRVEARKLRARLGKYSETEGSNDPIKFELPLGSYTPVFGRVPVLSRAGFSEIGLSTASPSKGGSSKEIPRLRIAVLRFENRGVSRRDDFFCEGVRDELNHAVACLPGLEVVSRTSVLQFEGRPIDARELATRLDVNAVIEGSISRSADRLRILVQLNGGSSGRTVWSQAYDRKLTPDFGLRSEIARAIAADLFSLLQKPNVIRALGTSANHSGGQARDARAYQDYLQGLYYWNRHRLEDLAEATRFFRRATERDVTFARAYTNLAYAQLMVPVLKAVLPSEVLGNARMAATRALELDPLSGEAHIALALPQVQEYQWREAGEEFRKGLDLSPSDPFGHAWYGMYLAAVGRTADALTEHERALELDPASPLTACCYGQTLYLLRRHQDAERYFRSALALDPSLPRAHAGLGLASLHQRNTGNAIAELERAQALTPGLGRVKASLGFAYATAGNPDRAREILNELLHRFAPAQFPAHMIAEIYIGLGDTDKAFQWLDTAIDQKDLTPFLTCDPLFDSLRTDSRFSSLLKRTNLA